ncbi:zinc ribbon domain-containing protein [Nibricoccus sp. IMCC34717]|uniref:zinc ribbon domain-containing protein n=1 Tax=Nibricoccus sp. IMCC34717 TaxID=3034021 RepID=UPI00384FB64F
MRHPALEALLILQDRDSKRLGLQAQLTAVPREVAAVEQKIASERAAIEAAKAEWQGLEAKKKGIENEIGSAEQKLAKYKTQQSAVRKNDEFQALGKEIETTQAGVAALEEQELGVMYQIDEAKKRFAAAEAELKKNISGHEAKLKALRERDVNLRAELKAAEAEVAQARAPLPEPVTRQYDRIAVRTQPAVVALRGSKCTGCHLKVSSEVESDSRKSEKLATCDQCGRIVWWDV